MLKLYRSLIRVTFLSVVIALNLSAQSFGQKLFMNPIKYTDRLLSVYRSDCANPSTIHLFINNVPIPVSDITTHFIVQGYWAFEIEFGRMKPGDVFKATDDCGGTAFQQVVKDDYVYVEVPGGIGHGGNGIGPNDEYAPYSKLSTPVSIGKCAPVNIDSHGLVNFNFFCPNTGGKFLLNGSPLNDQPSAVNPGGFDINYNGYPGTAVYTFNPDGSVTTNTAVKLESNTHYSGQIPIVLEYHHNGGPIDGPELSFGFKAMSFRHVAQNEAQVEKASLGGAIITTTYPSTPLSKYKLTYDGVYYRAYIDGVLVNELRRFVEYAASSGTLTPGSGAGLDYSTPVVWQGMNSGPQWVSVLIDGVLYTRQQFQVAADLIVNPTVTNVACSSGSSGGITVNATGGQAPLQYALDNGAYVSSNVFQNLAAASYVVKVRDATGCVASRNVTIGASTAVQLQVTSKTNESCGNSANGSVTLQASGGAGGFTYSKDGTSFVSSSSFTGLAAGPYVFSAKDDNGCVATVRDTIKTSSKILATVATQQNVFCFSGNNGAVTIGTSGSTFTGAAQYSIDNGVSFQATGVFTGLTAGVYQVVVKDDLCSASINVTITQPTEVTVSASIQQPVSCAGLADAAIQASAQGGSGAFQFSKDGTTYATASLFAGLAAGNYKVWAKDANGCVAQSGVIAISQPTALAVSIQTKTDANCFGSNTGSVTLNATGGTTPFQFSKDGTNFQSAATFGSLTAGAFSVTAKDAHGCLATVNAEILQPADITLTATATATVSCFGGNNGQISASAAGGTGSLQYAINATDFAASSNFSNLSAGTYQITARDANGCLKKSANVSVSQPTDIALAFTKTDALCYASTDGTVTVSATGGTGAYTFSKDAVGYQASGIFQALAAGAYTFSVKDANSCVRTIAVAVAQPAELTATNTAISQVLCFNGNSGIIQASAQGGTLPYQYSMNGSSYQAPASFGSLAIGTYKIWVKDAHGCIKETGSVTLSQPADLLASVQSQSAVKCYGGNDGTVQLLASGGVAPYMYSKDSLAFQPAAQFAGLPAAAIRFIVKDANGCTKPVPAQVAQPAAPYVITLASASSLTCYQNNGGRIEVKNAGGTAPYQVSIDNNSFQSSEVFGNLPAGAYTVYGKDANSCTFQLTGVSLNQPSNIVVTLLSKKDVDCEYYTKGEAKVLAEGSNGNFSYTLEGKDFKFNPISPQTNTSGLFQNLSAGDYTVKARDQSGCVMDFPLAIIPKSSNIRYEVTKSLPSSCTSEDGSISVINTSGGRPPYQYSISAQNSFSSNATFGGLLNGTYIVTVADELCSYKKEVDLTLPNSIKADYAIEPVSCATPVANLNVTGITGGNGNYQLALNGGGFSANRTFTGLHPNVYQLLVQDSPLSCKTAIGIEIKEQNRADLQIASRQNVLCYGGNSGSVTLQGNNNMGPFTYSIDGQNFSSNAVFGGLSIGTFHFYAKNRLGCIDSLTTTLTQPTPLTSSFTKKDNDCYGDNTGGLELLASGGTPAYSYSVDGATYMPSGKFDALVAKNYTAYVRDANGCISTQSVAVVQPPLLSITPVYQDTVRCFGESNGVVNLVSAGGTPSYQYSSNGTDFITTPTFSGLAVGSYRFFVKDAKGCSKMQEITLTQPQALTLSLVSKQDPLCFESSDGKIQLVSSGGNGGNIFALDNGHQQPQDLFQNLTQATYNIKVTDRKGCSAAVNSIALKWPEKIQTSYATVMPVCNGDANGTITVDVKGGTPAYTALFQGKQSSPVGSQFTFSGVSSATYPIDIQDKNGCTVKLSIVLEQPTALTGQITLGNNKCFGDQTGSIQVTGSGATPAYSYAIDNGSFSANGQFSGLKAGSYQLHIRDQVGCKFSKTIELTQPSLVSLTAVNTDTVRCFGEKNGSIRISATGGTPDYVYSQNGLQYYSDNTFKNLAAGAYRFRVKDANACEQTTTLTITQPEALKVSLQSKKDPLCAGDQNGQIVLVAAGGNSGYTFWKDNAAQQPAATFTGLTQAEYAFKVIDRKGCEDNLEPVKLTWPKPLQSQVSFSAPICTGEQNGQIHIAASGGTAPYTIAAPGITARPTVTPQGWNYAGMAAGRYVINTRDANGCFSMAIVNMPAATALREAIFPTAEPVCAGQEVLLDANNPGQNIQWFFNAAEVTASKNAQTFNAVTAGTYKVIVTSQTGCVLSKEYTLVNNNNALKADFLMTVQAFVGDTITALDISKPTPDVISWQLPAQAEVISEQTGKLAYAVISAGEYTIKMLAKKGDCLNTKIRTIKIFDKEDIDQTDSLLHYQDTNLIQEMVLYPNPNFGKFTVTVKLTKVMDAVMTIAASTSNTTVLQAEKKGDKNYVFEVDMKDFSQQIYVVTIRAGKSVLYKRALIMN